MIDLNHGNGASNLGQTINTLIDQALEAKAVTQSAWRKHLGASMLGAECARQIQLDWLKTWNEHAPPDDYEAGKLKPDHRQRQFRYFDLGHRLEAAVSEWLTLAGFELRTRGRDGKQFGFETGGGRLKGHIDGVLVSGPSLLRYPALWECKTANEKSWNEMAKKGVAQAQPKYAAQIALYQAYLDLTENPCLFTAINKNTAEIYHEAVAFDGDLAQRTSDLAVEILQATDAGELMPTSLTPDHYLCRLCRWQNVCWGT